VVEGRRLSELSEKEEARFLELAELASKYAAAHAQAEYLGEFRKSKKALLMKEAEVSGHKTAAMQEREAYAHPGYAELLEGLKVATETALACKWKLEIARMKFEAWRTRHATRRAEMNLR
jgi:hypothetical protein